MPDRVDKMDVSHSLYTAATRLSYYSLCRYMKEYTGSRGVSDSLRHDLKRSMLRLRFLYSRRIVLFLPRKHTFQVLDGNSEPNAANNFRAHGLRDTNLAQRVANNGHNVIIRCWRNTQVRVNSLTPCSLNRRPCIV